jgi:4-hydroxy-2-oxoheptanedioate aldolase
MTSDPLLAEELARCGFDEVTIDLQHGSVEVGHVMALAQAIADGGAVPLVRLPSADPVVIGRCLDLGALGVVIAMVETPDQAATAVTACRYAPLGRRSAGTVRAQHTMGSRDLAELGSVACFAMVESRQGLDNVEAIAATPGVDGIYVGPGDLAISLGMWPPSDRTPAQQQQFDAALDRVLAACEAAGVVAGMHTGDGLSAASYVRRGFRMVTVASEYGLVIAGGHRELEAARAAISG